MKSLLIVIVLWAYTTKLHIILYKYINFITFCTLIQFYTDLNAIIFAQSATRDL